MYRYMHTYAYIYMQTEMSALVSEANAKYVDVSRKRSTLVTTTVGLHMHSSVA